MAVVREGINSVLWGIFEAYIVLFCRELISFTFERIGKYPTGEICVRAITFPIKE